MKLKVVRIRYLTGYARTHKLSYVTEPCFASVFKQLCKQNSTFLLHLICRKEMNVEFLKTVQKMREREGKKAVLSHFEGSQANEVSAVGFLLPSTVAKYRAFLVVDAFFALVSDKLDIRAN